MLDDGRAKTRRDAVPPNEAFLEVRRSHFECVPLELACGETVPGMLRILGRTRAAIKPDQTIAGRLLKRYAVADELTIDRIDFLLDAHRIERQGLIIRATRA